MLKNNNYSVMKIIGMIRYSLPTVFAGGVL